MIDALKGPSQTTEQLQALPQSRRETLKQFEAANEKRDYRIYAWLMDAPLFSKAARIFPHFGEVKEDAVIVDAGSGSGKLAELTAQTFRGANVFALDLSHELLEIADKGKALVKLVFGDAKEQNFKPNSVDVKFYSTSGHEIESFGGTGSMEKAVENSFIELAPEGKLVIRDFVKPQNKMIYMKISSNVGINAVSIDAKRKDIDYSLLSTQALFERFHLEFGGGNQFNFEVIERNGERFYQLPLEWAYEFYMRKDYTANWRSEIKEKYSYWTMDQAREILEKKGFTNVQVIPEWNSYIVDNRLQGKIALFEEKDGQLVQIPLPPTHMVVVGEKPRREISEEKEENPEVDYEKLLKTIKIEGGEVSIGQRIFRVKEGGIKGSKKHIFKLLGDRSEILKVVRGDALNTHNTFKSMFQIIERQEILEEMHTPHVKVLDFDRAGPPYRFLIQEDVPEGSINAADLVRSGELTEEDVRQMAEIVNSYEKAKQWQLDTNPYSWFRVKKGDDSTQMVYVSNKVYRYDENWAFAKVGLLQWINSRYVQDAKDYSAAIPTSLENEQFKKTWERGEGVVALWKKHLDPEVLSELFN